MADLLPHQTAFALRAGGNLMIPTSTNEIDRWASYYLQFNPEARRIVDDAQSEYGAVLDQIQIRDLLVPNFRRWLVEDMEKEATFIDSIEPRPTLREVWAD